MDYLKKKYYDVLWSPRVYRFYAKMISKTLSVCPSRNFNAHEVLPGLYVGDVMSAYNYNELKKRNITHIVTVVMGIYPIFPKDFKYMNVHIRDMVDENIAEYFPEVIKFIDEGRATGNVLVHCLRGVSRSGTIAAAYVVHTQKMTPAEAIAFLRQKRSIISPNTGFVQQLDKYYDSLSVLPPSNTNVLLPPTTTMAAE